VVNGDSSTLDVSLGKVSQTAFTGSGSTTSTTRFDIQLKDCPETITSAAITFGGSADGTNANVLAVTPGTGAATGVGIQLLDKTENPLSLYTASTSYTLQSGTTTNDLVFGTLYPDRQHHHRRPGECGLHLYRHVQLILRCLALCGQAPPALSESRHA